MIKYTEIGGIAFETIKSSKTQDMIDYHVKNFACRDLSDFYVKPSDIKKRIYEEWREWYLNTDGVYRFEVTSGSSHVFTICAIYRDEETLDAIGFIRITKGHDRLYVFK